MLDLSAYCGPSALDVQIKGRDGQFRWFLVTWEVPFAATRPRLHRTLVAVDINERKLAEQARDLDAANIRTTLQHVPTMIWRTDPSGQMDYANDRYLAVWGQKLKDIVGWGWKNSIHPDDVRGIVNYWARQVENGDDGMYEFRVGTPERGYRWCMSICTPHRDTTGEILKWYGATFDIEDRKLAEDRLRQSEAFLKQGQLISKTGSIGLNTSTGEHYWSDETYRILEIDQSTRPSFEALFERVHPDDRSFMSATIDHLRAAEPAVDVQYRLLMPNGIIKHVRILAGLPQASFDATTYLGVIMDITGIKHAEDAIHRTQAELARITRIATMAELTASVAHELNQPLAAILTNSEACLRWLDRSVPDIVEARQAVERTVADAKRASSVVRQLRAIFTQKEPETVAFDLNRLVEATLPLVRSHINHHQATATLDLAPDLPLVSADPVQIQQVVINLITNGLQSPSARDAHVRKLRIATAIEDNCAILLSVADNGRGIEEDHIERLFDLFFTTKSDGMGVGLSICRSIVEAHGGRIMARNNEEGIGATVSFTLPIDVSNVDEYSG